MYRGAAVLFGAEDGAARNPDLELGLPCIGEPPYYLAQRMERLGIRTWRSAGGIAVLCGAQDSG